jgi:hypothetical protein
MRHHEYRKIRRLYFQQNCFEDIALEVGLSPRRVKSEITNARLVNKRDRYYRFLVNYAYSHGEQLEDIARRLGINVLSLRRVKRKFNITTKRHKVHNKKITEADEMGMIDYYAAGLSTQKVAEKFGFKTSKTVEDVLKKYEVACRPPMMRRQLDYGYFDKIDSHDKAYILGLLYTDGYIYKDYDGFCIQLTEKDGYLLDRIAARIGQAVSVIKIDCDCKRKVLPNAKDMMRMGVYSKILAERVADLGVVRRKTYCLKMTNKMPKEFNYSFMRGVIDGDGTIGVYGNKVVCGFSTKSSWFAAGVCGLRFDEELKFYYIPSTDMFSVYVMGGKQKILNFLSKIYEHKSDLFLLRKYEKVQDQIMQVCGQRENLQCNYEK